MKTSRTRILAAALATTTLAATAAGLAPAPAGAASKRAVRPATAATGPVGQAAPVVNPSINPDDRTSVLSAFHASYEAAKGVPTGWTGSVAGCVKGTESTASIDATRAAVNFFRAMNKLPAVTMDATYNSQALAAALLMEARGSLSHNPPSSDPCWTQEASDAAGSSNLSFGTGELAIRRYMDDTGASNTFAGHRRWVLYPRAAALGTGSTNGFNALKTVGATYADRPSGVDWVAWPSAGYVPKSLVPGRWSLSNNAQPGADYSAASVTVKVGGQSLPVTTYAPVTGYGDNTLTWDVTLPSDLAATTADVNFDVTVSGIKTSGGVALVPRTYTVKAIAGDAPAAPSTAPVAEAKNGYATLEWEEPADGGSPITGYKVTPYVGGVAQTPTTFNSTSTFQNIFPLTNGTTYTFKVQAINVVGTGAASPASNAVTPSAPATTPGAPTGVSATAGNGQATVSWTAPSSNGGSAITGYKVTPYVGGSAQSVRTFNSTATSQVITGLSNGTAYTFKVQAVNGVGTGAASAASNSVTPSAATPGYAPYASWGQLVDQLHQRMLGTAPSASERSSWVSQLTAGTKQPGDYVAFLRADAFETSTVDPVARLFSAYFLRLPDLGGFDYWVAQRSGGRSLASISDFFATSSEFKSRYGSLSNQAFVQLVYQNVLGRPGEASGVAYWTGQLDAKKTTRGKVMVGFSESSEYKGKRTNTNHVAVLYLQLLDRAPTTNELDAGVQALATGTTLANFARTLLPQVTVL